MPFKSKAQMRYLYAKEPKVAEEFASETPPATMDELPTKTGTKREFASMLNERSVVPYHRQGKGKLKKKKKNAKSPWAKLPMDGGY